jgi:hypothetical protein
VSHDIYRLIAYVDSLRLPRVGEAPVLEGPRTALRPRVPGILQADRMIALAEKIRGSGGFQTAIAERVLDWFRDPYNPETIWALRRERDTYGRT